MRSLVKTIAHFVSIAALSTSVSFSLNAQEEESNKSANNNAKKVQETVLGMNVSGNKELPNVLYIVPWKSDSTPAPLPEVTRLVDEIYSPVDPEVFSKQVKFYHQLTELKSEASEVEVKD